MRVALAMMAIMGAAWGFMSQHPPKPQRLNVTLLISGEKVQKYTTLEEVNKVLHTIGAHISEFDYFTPESIPLLKASEHRMLTNEEQQVLLDLYPVTLEEMRYHREVLAGRPFDDPTQVHMVTEEVGQDPYPKVFLVNGKNQGTGHYVGGRVEAGFKFGPLHSNSIPYWDAKQNKAVSISMDELSTILSGGPYQTYFQMNDGEVARLICGRVTPGEVGWKLTYAGITPHGGFATNDINSGDVTSIQHIAGPKAFYMTYYLSNINSVKNPWIDLTGPVPVSSTVGQVEQKEKDDDHDHESRREHTVPRAG